jgi:hypothetical protein
MATTTATPASTIAVPVQLPLGQVRHELSRTSELRTIGAFGGERHLTEQSTCNLRVLRLRTEISSW